MVRHRVVSFLYGVFTRAAHRHTGAFRMKTEEDGTQSPDPAQFQMFQCRHAPAAAASSLESENAGDLTLFTNTSMIYRQLIETDVSPYASEVKSGMWTVYTPANTTFG